MVNDLQVAAGLMQAFQQQQETHRKERSNWQENEAAEAAGRVHDSSSTSATVETVMIGDVEFSVQALSTAHWPTYPGKCRPPTAVAPRQAVSSLFAIGGKSNKVCNAQVDEVSWFGKSQPEWPASGAWRGK